MHNSERTTKILHMIPGGLLLYNIFTLERFCGLCLYFSSKFQYFSKGVNDEKHRVNILFLNASHQQLLHLTYTQNYMTIFHTTFP